MNFHKFISTILHPIVIPTIGVMLYFLLNPINSLNSNQKFKVLSLIFVVSYLIPVLVLIIFKRIKLIKSFKVDSIKERKIPIALMVFMFYFLGNTMNSIPNLRNLSVLFYSSAIALITIYILLLFKVKTSIHLLSIGLPTGYFLILGHNNSQPNIILTIVLILLAGVLASARLKLKAHKASEVYLGFFLGFSAPILLNYIL